MVIDIETVKLIKWYQTKGDLYEAIEKYVDGEYGNGTLLNLDHIHEHFEWIACPDVYDDEWDNTVKPNAKKYVEAIEAFVKEHSLDINEVRILYSW